MPRGTNVRPDLSIAYRRRSAIGQLPSIGREGRKIALSANSAHRRGNQASDFDRYAMAGLAAAGPVVAGTQVLGTGQTEAQCGESWKPLHSVHLVGSIT